MKKTINDIDEQLEYIKQKEEKLNTREQFLNEFYANKYKDIIESAEQKNNTLTKKNWKLCQVCAELIQIIDCICTSDVLSYEYNKHSINEILNYLRSSSFNRAINKVNCDDIAALTSVNKILNDRSDINKFVETLLESRPSAKWAIEKYYNNPSTNAIGEDSESI